MGRGQWVTHKQPHFSPDPKWVAIFRPAGLPLIDIAPVSWATPGCNGSFCPTKRTINILHRSLVHCPPIIPNTNATRRCCSKGHYYQNEAGDLANSRRARGIVRVASMSELNPVLELLANTLPVHETKPSLPIPWWASTLAQVLHRGSSNREGAGNSRALDLRTLHERASQKGQGQDNERGWETWTAIGWMCALWSASPWSLPHLNSTPLLARWWILVSMYNWMYQLLMVVRLDYAA